MAKTTLETETKYDVGDDVSLPDLSMVPGVARIEERPTMTLLATYFDTPDLALARAGITLRRRTGGHDDGWHLKLPDHGGRQEIHLPLSRAARRPPLALRRIVLGVTGGVDVDRVLDLVSERRELLLREEDDTMVAVVCDDRVTATRPGPDGDLEEGWREWEVEAHGAPGKTLKRLGAALRDAGARPSPHPSKPARALALPSAAAAEPPMAVPKKATARDVLQPQVTQAVVDLRSLDPLVRANTPDAVHQMRILCRRLRGIATTFSRELDDSAASVAAEVKWLGRVLGRARDLEVLQEHLDTMLADLPPELNRGGLARWVDTRLRQSHRTALEGMVAEMSTDRYVTLLSALDSWAVSAPWSSDGDKPAGKALDRALSRSWADLEGAIKAARKARGTEEHESRLHEVRKAAKRVRYAVDAVTPAGISGAKRMGRTAKSIHRVLGHHQDAVVAADALRELAVAAHAEGRDAFALGVVHARCHAAADEHRREFDRLWKRAR